MPVTTRSRGVLTSFLSASKAGVTKRTKASSSSSSAGGKSRKLAVVTVDAESAPAPAPALAMAASASVFDAELAHRPASPRSTNAPLISPPSASPVVTQLICPPATTDNILARGIAHLLSVDPTLKPLIDKYHCGVFSPEGLAEAVDPFHSLISGIISQQVSGAAARSIKAKFVRLFAPDGDGEDTSFFPTPQMVLSCSIDTLRTAGLSQRKAEYAHSLAEKFISGELSAEILANASDAEIVEKLVKVRGIGAWSAEMFLMFGLKRMDVFSTGDLGIQRGMAAHMGRDVNKIRAKGGGKWKYMSEEEMLRESEKYKPYRSMYSLEPLLFS
jgi:DNA-3-methyladenine glycosylase II